jgi:peroxiredoxin Q/BCP
MPAVGRLAPDFTLPSDGGEPITLSSLRGRFVVLYFYPEDDTPGCTVEACEFRDVLPRFEGLDAVVLGVSPDSVESHRAFREKYSLPFTLLSDADRSVCRLYRVWKRKTLFGHAYMGVVRSTFIVDPDGRLAWKVEGVRRIEGHAAQVAEALRALGTPRASHPRPRRGGQGP